VRQVIVSMIAVFQSLGMFIVDLFQVFGASLKLRNCSLRHELNMALSRRV